MGHGLVCFKILFRFFLTFNVKIVYSKHLPFFSCVKFRTCEKIYAKDLFLTSIFSTIFSNFYRIKFRNEKVQNP